MSDKDVSIKLKGLGNIEKELKKMYGDTGANKKLKPVIDSGTKIVQRELKRDLEVFRDTGATIDENIATKTRIDRYGILRSHIMWDPKGKKQRFRLVHLNEWGYTRYGKRVDPRGMGVIENSVRSSSDKYVRHVRKGVEQWLK